MFRHKALYPSAFILVRELKSFSTMMKKELSVSLVIASRHDSNEETIESWSEEIRVIKSALKDYAGRGSLFFEYNIPRLGKRPMLLY